MINQQNNWTVDAFQGNSLFADQMNKSKIGSFPSSSSNLYSFSPPANAAITRPTPASQNSIGSAHSKMPILEPGDVLKSCKSESRLILLIFFDSQRRAKIWLAPIVQQ